MFTRYFRFHLQDGKRGKGRNVEISSSSKTSNPLNEKGPGKVSVDYVLCRKSKVVKGRGGTIFQSQMGCVILCFMSLCPN